MKKLYDEQKTDRYQRYAGISERSSMTQRRRRRERRKRRTGCAAALILLVLLGAGAAYGIPWVIDQFGGQVRETFGETVEKAVNTLSAEPADFQELTISEEEVEGNFYYEQLNGEEQIIYRELLQGVQDMEDCITIHAGREDHPEKVYEYLLYDCPELFWCVGSSQMTVYEDHTEFYPTYSCTSDERIRRQGEIDAAVSDCIKGNDPAAGEFDRIRYVYEYLVNTVDYDEDAPDNQNIYSALVGKSSVCAGYSRAAQYLLNHMGIECIYVVGTAQGQEAHAWNIVNCGGKYYQMDVTFGDPVFLSSESGENLPGNIIYYDYLCCTDTEIMADHTPTDEVTYPTCESNDLNYYRMNGMYYESYDPQILLGDMNDSIYERQEMFVCKFSSSKIYQNARGAVIEELFPKAAQTLGSVYGLEQVKYTYIEDETHNKIMVFWNYQ